MGFVVNREAKLVCDLCGKEKITTSYSNNYGFKVLKIGDCYQMVVVGLKILTL